MMAESSTTPELIHPFDWEGVLYMVEHRLGMWVGRPTYERAVALITGFDLSQPISIAPAMQERVRVRRGRRVPIGWPWVLLVEALGGDFETRPDLGPLTPEEDAAAIKLLVAEVRAVIAARFEATS